MDKYKKFKEEMIFLENEKFDDIVILEQGSKPFILTSVHSMNQKREDGTIKFKEPFTKAIARYVAKKNDCTCFFKTRDNGIDSNRSENDIFKSKLLEFINTHDTKIVLDIHGAREDRDFDVELGTLDNKTAKASTVNCLKECFIKNGLTKIEMNNPFKGGKVTQFLFENTDVEVIQIEINGKYRNEDNIEDMKKVVDSIEMTLNNMLRLTAVKAGLKSQIVTVNGY